MSEPRIALHWQILIGMAAGLVFGLVASAMGWQEFSSDWVKPFGTIFINMLKLIAIPLIITSLIKGVSDLQDISKFSRMGGRTVALYLFTTLVAVTIGLLIANAVKPGSRIADETREDLLKSFEVSAQTKIEDAAKQKEQGPLQPLVDLVPDNIFSAATSNRNMLQVIFFVVCFGVGLILIRPDQAKPVKDFFDGLNEVILKLVDLIMLIAPFGVFALLSSLIVEAPGTDLLLALSVYSVCVLIGLAILIFVFYPALVIVFTKRSYVSFFQGISPAQLLAFSTSSSAATLPVTMERVEEHIGVEQ
jgi:Na+/H+-dicarboxylate symporter